MALTRPQSARAEAIRRITVLGSTGSVGTSTVDLIRRNADRFAVEALTAHRNVALLAEQARALRPRLAVIGEPGRRRQLEEALAGTGIETAAGPDAMVEAASRPADLVMAAIVGAAGLEPTLAAVRRGARRGARQQGDAWSRAGRLMMERGRAAGAPPCCRSIPSTTRSSSASTVEPSRGGRDASS